MSTPIAISRRSRTRFVVLAAAVGLAAITYLDRVCINHPVIRAAIESELRLSDRQMSLVFSAFILGYALFEMPTGAWGDRIGPRRVLTRIVLWWSAFTIATAAATRFSVMLLVRFLFGAGEAGAFPNVTKTFSRWFPLTERGTAQGIFFAGAHLAGGLSPLLVTAMLGFLPWRAVFVVFGIVGALWALGWFAWFRDEPADHPAVNAEERVWIESQRGPSAETPHLNLRALRRILSNRVMIALCLMYFTQSYGFYINITWLPTYLNENRGLTTEQFGAIAPFLWGLPMTLSAFADILGGMASDRLSQRHGLWVGRSGLGFVSMVVASLALIAGALVGDPILAALLIAISGAADSFQLGACWGTCQDIAGPHAGLVSGTMNTAGQIGALLCPIMFTAFENRTIPLCIAGGLFLFGALCWLFVDPRRPIDLD